MRDKVHDVVDKAQNAVVFSLVDVVNVHVIDYESVLFDEAFVNVDDEGGQLAHDAIWDSVRLALWENKQ